MPRVEELARYVILVPPPAHLPTGWHTSGGHAAEGPAAPRDERRYRFGARWNTHGPHEFWEGCVFDKMLIAY